MLAVYEQVVLFLALLRVKHVCYYMFTVCHVTALVVFHYFIFGYYYVQTTALLKVKEII